MSQKRIDELEEALAWAVIALADVAGYIGPFEAKSKFVYDSLCNSIDEARKVLDHPYIEGQLIRNQKPDRTKPPKIGWPSETNNS